MSENFTMDITPFGGVFKDFGEFFTKVELQNYIIRAFPRGEGTYAIYKRIKGVIPYKNDYILITSNAEDFGSFAQLDDYEQRFGVEFILLSQLLGGEGCMIIPDDQCIEMITNWSDKDGI